MKIPCWCGSLTVAALTTALVAAGCAESEPFNFPNTHGGADGNGAAGTGDSNGVSPAGSAGATGAAGVGVTGAAGSSGAAGTTGAAGAGAAGITAVRAAAASRDAAAPPELQQGAAAVAAQPVAVARAVARPAGWQRGTGRQRRCRDNRRRQRMIDAGVAPDGGAAPTFTQVYDSILVVYCAGADLPQPRQCAQRVVREQVDRVHRRPQPGDAGQRRQLQLLRAGEHRPHAGRPGEALCSEPRADQGVD